MKNIPPQPIPRQNNCRKASPVSIPSQAGVDNGSSSWQARPGSVVRFSHENRHKRKPRSLLRSGFSLSASALPYQSLRFASAMTLAVQQSDRRLFKKPRFQVRIYMLGHVSIQTTERYYAQTPDMCSKEI